MRCLVVNKRAFATSGNMAHFVHMNLVGYQLWSAVFDTNANASGVGATRHG